MKPPPSSPPPRRGCLTRLLRGLVLLLVNLALVGILAAGLLLVWPMAKNLAEIRADVVEVDPSMVARFKPNLRDEPYLHTKISGDPTYEVLHLSTNAQGFRDVDHALRARPGERRVAFVGDSFVFGMDLAAADTIPAQVAAAFAARGGLDGQPVEVFNFGLPGLNAEGMGRVTQIFAAPYAPEVVVYSFISDDVSRTDIVSWQEWVRDWGPWMARLPVRIERWLREDGLVRLKMLRYQFDTAVFKLLPGLYARRVATICAFWDELARAHGHRVLIMDFSRFPPGTAALQACQDQHPGRVRLLTGFPVELNPRNQHPTAACTHALAPLLADAITALLAPGTDAPAP